MLPWTCASDRLHSGAMNRAKLMAENGEQLYVPAGFAHGFMTLEPETEVAYKVSSAYAPGHEGGLLWNDPDLGIEWPFAEADSVVSEKDRVLPRLSEFDSPFIWDRNELQSGG